VSYKVIPLYRESQFSKDLIACPGMLRGVRNTVLLGKRPNGRSGAPQVAPDVSLPDRYELAGYWAATDNTPVDQWRGEWKGLMKYTKYLRGMQREKRIARLSRVQSGHVGERPVQQHLLQDAPDAAASEGLLDRAVQGNGSDQTTSAASESRRAVPDEEPCGIDFPERRRRGRRPKGVYRRDPLHVLAWKAVKDALRDGRLRRPSSCEECGLVTRRLQAHHGHGYLRPNWLKVSWLCRTCHDKVEYLCRTETR